MEKQAEALGLCVQHLKIVQKNGQLERRVATLEEVRRMADVHVLVPCVSLIDLCGRH